MSSSFHQYIKLYPEALKLVNDCLGNSKLPILEEIALRFCYALESRSLDLKSGNERIFLSDLLTRSTSEMFAVIGVMRSGALIPAYHHTRSIIELYSALEHIYCVPAKRERKLEKYVEFKKVAKYLHYRERKRLFDAGQISIRDFSETCSISEEEFNELHKRIHNWNRIWKLEQKDPDVIQHWHYPDTIQGLFESSGTTRMCGATYENICHATHLSPLGLGLSAGNLIIGFPRNENGYDYKKINSPISFSILTGQLLADFLRSTVKAGIIEGVSDYSIDDL